MASLILTVLGPDRPGVISALSHAVAARGGSWLESRMSRLAGQFAGIVLVDAPEALLLDLPALERGGLRIVGQIGGAAAQVSGELLALEVVGNDRPGIVRDVTGILAGSGINIEEFTTNIEAGSFTGGTLFRATARLRAPDAAAVENVRRSLEALGNELMVDIQPANEVRTAG